VFIVFIAKENISLPNQRRYKIY